MADISPLRQRPIDDIAIRWIGPNTQHDDSRRVAVPLDRL